MSLSLTAWLEHAWSHVSSEPLSARAWQVCPRPELGDLSHQGAFLYARAQRCDPLALAQRWHEALTRSPHPWIETVTVVPPGFLNLRVSEEGWTQFLKTGDVPRDLPVSPPPTLVEFVSANPTGPLHLGHARQAVLGDVAVRLLKRQGGKVASEFFYNDAGVQIEALMASVDLRVKELQGATLQFERDGASCATLDPGAHLFGATLYHGTYITDLAQAWLESGVGQDKQQAFILEQIQAQQTDDLAAMGVTFDATASEQALFESGAVHDVLKGLLPHSYKAVLPRTTNDRHAHAKESTSTSEALYFTSSAWGDDTDRVTVKSDGTVTYFVSDVAYHLAKWQRGWKRAINIQGSDHHGTVARVRAGVQALCPEAGPTYPEVILHTMVTVVHNGKPMKASKRAGGYVTARDLVDCLGVDAFRLSMLDKKPDSPMKIDIQRWHGAGVNNPVYQVQYAHARVCSALDKAASTSPGDVQAPTWTVSERRLLAHLFVYPVRLDAAAADVDPTRAAHLWRELGSVLHEMYQTAPKLLHLDAPSRVLRLPLFERTREALREGGDLLGVTCPDRMHLPTRAADAETDSDHQHQVPPRSASATPR